jgi:lipopolysaccharide/colanic/teichoic acid biosynthesis glycosyltransferase
MAPRRAPTAAPARQAITPRAAFEPQARRPTQSAAAAAAAQQQRSGAGRAFRRFLAVVLLLLVVAVAVVVAVVIATGSTKTVVQAQRIVAHDVQTAINDFRNLIGQNTK